MTKIETIPEMEYRFELDVPGSNANGAGYQASASTTTIGVRWMLQGELARAVRALIMAERERAAKIVYDLADEEAGDGETYAANCLLGAYEAIRGTP